MSWYRKNPLFALALTLCVLLALGEGWCIYERCTAARAAAKKLAQKQAQLAEMTTLTPPPKGAPDLERIEAVFHQRQIAQYLLESLLEAHPRALLAVKRERPLTRKEREERDAAAIAAAAAAASGTPAEPVAETSAPEE